MKAFTRRIYGGPEILKLEEVQRPTPKSGEILVKVHANSANPADWHIIRGKPFFARFTFGLFKPHDLVPGADFAGIVVEKGDNVSLFNVGDSVFGETLRGGAFAEYVNVPETVCALMPASASFDEMAAIPVAGLTAFQALITHGKLKQNESVLINGASGGVGHFTVQIAKAYGARVTGICSSRNVDFVKSLGADQTIAYDQENIHQHNGKYDLVVDTNGNLNYEDYKRMGKRGVMVGFTGIAHMVAVMSRKAIGKFPLIQFTAAANTADLQTLASLKEAGKIKAHIEKVYPYQKTPEAVAYIEAMRTKGKVVMIWQ